MQPKKKIQEIYFLVNKVKAIQHYLLTIYTCIPSFIFLQQTIGNLF